MGVKGQARAVKGPAARARWERFTFRPIPYSMLETSAFVWSVGPLTFDRRLYYVPVKLLALPWELLFAWPELEDASLDTSSICSAKCRRRFLRGSYTVVRCVVLFISHGVVWLHVCQIVTGSPGCTYWVYYRSPTCSCQEGHWTQVRFITLSRISAVSHVS